MSMWVLSFWMVVSWVTLNILSLSHVAWASFWLIPPHRSTNAISFMISWTITSFLHSRERCMSWLWWRWGENSTLRQRRQRLLQLVFSMISWVERLSSAELNPSSPVFTLLSGSPFLCFVCSQEEELFYNWRNACFTTDATLVLHLFLQLGNDVCSSFVFTTARRSRQFFILAKI